MKHKIIFCLLIVCSCQISKAQVINGFEYWFDMDYQNRILVNVQGNMVTNFGSAVNTSSLSQGYHTLWYHTKDSFGQWSVPVSSGFVKGNSEVAAIEYWFDMDYENRILVDVATAQSVSINVEENVSSLSQGHHILWYRVRDNEGIWSVPVSRTLVNGSNPISRIEYWYDNDYSTRQYLNLTSAENISFNGGLPVSGLAVGDHNIAVCMVDEQNQRSVPICTTFYYDGSIGVGDVASKPAIGLYPNPAHAELMLTGIEGFNQIIIMDQNGKAVLNHPFKFETKTENLNINSLAAGKYTVLLVSRDHCVTNSFVKE